MKLITLTPTVSSRTAEEIRAAILNGSLAPGRRLRQEELAEKLGVSREPVRKALVLLERDGLVNVVKRGAIVAAVDANFIAELFELRETIEIYVVGKLAEKTSFDHSPLQEIIFQGRKAVRQKQNERIIELDVAFHNGLYLASGNRVVSDMMKIQWSHIRRMMWLKLLTNSLQHIWDEHEGILNAITKHDSKLAQNLASQHIRSAFAMAMDCLDREAPAKTVSTAR